MKSLRGFKKFTEHIIYIKILHVFFRYETVGPIVFEDQFIQFSTKLSSTYLYGLGENPHLKLKHSFETRPTHPMFSRDQPITPVSKIIIFGIPC